MKKSIFLILLIVMSSNSLFACPCGFSPDDKRPFFEQYEIEMNTITQQEKEEKS